MLFDSMRDHTLHFPILSSKRHYDEYGVYSAKIAEIFS